MFFYLIFEVSGYFMIEYYVVKLRLKSTNENVSILKHIVIN